MTSLQRRLAAAGLYPAADIDGDFGPLMAAACAGAADRLLPALSAATPRGSVPWLQAAIAEIGVKEIAGAKHNPRVLEYGKAVSLSVTTDEVPWCSNFVSWCLWKAGIGSTRSARARSYEAWGVSVRAAPAPGAIAVFWRGESRSSGQGHVGFYMGGDPAGGRIAVLGGNQGDAVSLKVYATARLLDLRWPEGVPLPTEDEALAALEMVPDAVSPAEWA